MATVSQDPMCNSNPLPIVMEPNCNEEDWQGDFLGDPRRLGVRFETGIVRGCLAPTSPRSHKDYKEASDCSVGHMLQDTFKPRQNMLKRKAVIRAFTTGPLLSTTECKIFQSRPSRLALTPSRWLYDWRKIVESGLGGTLAD